MVKEKERCPTCGVPFGEDESGPKQRSGLCKKCDETMFPDGGLNSGNTLGAVRRAGGSLVMDGRNWTGTADSDNDGFGEALRENGCQGQGRLQMFKDLEQALEEARTTAILNAAPLQWICSGFLF